MTETEIIHQPAAHGGRYVLPLNKGDEAVMTYKRRDPQTIIIDHTGVPISYRGQGIALDLVKHGVAEARRNGDKIVPLCPYVAVQFRRNPEWADVLAA